MKHLTSSKRKWTARTKYKIWNKDSCVNVVLQSYKTLSPKKRNIIYIVHLVRLRFSVAMGNCRERLHTSNTWNPTWSWLLCYISKLLLNRKDHKWTRWLYLRWIWQKRSYNTKYILNLQIRFMVQNFVYQTTAFRTVVEKYQCWGTYSTRKNHTSLALSTQQGTFYSNIKVTQSL